MTPKNSMMMERCTCYAPTTRYNPSIRSCYTRRPGTMRPEQEKGIDPVVAWPVLLHTLGGPRNGSHQLLAPRVCDWWWCLLCACRCGFRPHWAPVVLQQLQHKEDSCRAAHPSWMDQAESDIRKQWQEARANRRMQFKVGNHRDVTEKARCHCWGV